MPVRRIDPASDRAVYRQIADHLRQAIESHELVAGTQLPSESALVNEYGVSRVTARRALSVLVTDGLVVAEHGRGWFVRRRPPVRRLSADRFARRKEGKAAFTVDMEANERTFTVDVLYVGAAHAPAEVLERLNLPAGSSVLVRRRRYLVEGQPVEYATSYVPLGIAAGTRIADSDPGPGGIYARMEDQGLIFERYDEEIRARMPSEDESRLLQLPVGSPVLHLVRTAIASGQPVEVCDTIMDSAAFVLFYSLPAA
ncbi:GntR family transcriptional regulator [Micromonospora sp. NBC_01813]|uniref:GntR family transcriptional regulator n=1 Tax=Micromonospora sp. NBC_01813 TaxID=2975988 RepID=UPI002DDB80DC|nr:GntR family transcriptional regulator [Micromonospora sp. NBC_01813]WSA11058.1 GntR family transcriptional regulator [Micromonospora sp. NBC_01813]